MFSYETDRHARSIFARWLTSALSQNGATPGESDVHAFAEAAARMAQTFSDAVEKYRSCVSGPGMRHPGSPQTIFRSVTFEQLVHEWQRHALGHVGEAERRKISNRFRRYLFPSIGSRSAEDIRTPELVAAFRAIEDRGFLPLAHLMLRETIRVYRFAIASGFALHNPAIDVRGALYQWRPKHRPTILVPERIGQLLHAIDGYHAVTTSKYMLRLLPLVFVRPGELRKAEWGEVDFKTEQWRIPARRMKARRPHIVPLSVQARRIFREVHRITGGGTYVFASARSASGVISEHLCTTMLQSIGFGGEITMSGFRSMAATLLSEQGWSADAIERQLSHLDPRSIRRTYNFAEYLSERRQMMQAWADYLDQLRSVPSATRRQRLAHSIVTQRYDLSKAHSC